MSADAVHLRATLLPYGDRPVDVWIADGRFTFAAQPGARELAPPGGFAAAGLVDCHTHLHFVDRPDKPHGRALVDENRRRHLAAGTVLLRDLGATSEDVLGLPDDDGLPRVQGAGRCLLVEDRYPFTVTAARELPAAISAQARAGARWVKIFEDWPGWPGTQEEPNFTGEDRVVYPTETLAEAVRAAHAAGARVAVHAFGEPAARAGVEAGVDSLEHGWGLDEGLLRTMGELRIGWTPMLSIAAPMLASAEHARLPHQAAWIRRTLERMDTLLPLARRLGVPVLAGTDWFPSVTLADEVGLLHRHGLAPADALACATTDARAFLGVPDLIEGAPADLVLFDADPREDLRRLSRPALVMLGGRVARADGR